MRVWHLFCQVRADIELGPTTPSRQSAALLMPESLHRSHPSKHSAPGEPTSYSAWRSTLGATCRRTLPRQVMPVLLRAGRAGRGPWPRGSTCTLGVCGRAQATAAATACRAPAATPPRRRRAASPCSTLPLPCSSATRAPAAAACRVCCWGSCSCLQTSVPPGSTAPSVDALLAVCTRVGERTS